LEMCRFAPKRMAAQALDMPGSLHSITGMGRESQWDFKPGNRHMDHDIRSRQCHPGERRGPKKRNEILIAAFAAMTNECHEFRNDR